MKKKLELYLHIPFCIQKCDYCDFLSFPLGEFDNPMEQEKVEGQYEVVKKYITALEKEISGYKEMFRDYKVSTIFMGGGTPSILLGEEIVRLFSALTDSFDISKESEITIEANPGTVTKDKVTAWRKVGINRVSIGLQSTKDEELKLLGRIHTFRQFIETFALLREDGFSNINVDLISGIPGQTLESFIETLGEVIKLEPEHISAYSLIVEEGTRFGEIYGDKDLHKDIYEGIDEDIDIDKDKDIGVDLPSEDTDRAIYKKTKEILEENGYHQYEVSNYAKEGFQCGHNLGYWDRVNYLGLGLGAASLIESRRFNQVKDLNQYLKKFLETNEKGEKENHLENIVILNKDDQMAEFMFLGLRKTKGISKSRFKEEFGRSINEVYGEVLLELIEKSLIEVKDDYISLTDKGVDLSNYVLAEFLI